MTPAEENVPAHEDQTAAPAPEVPAEPSATPTGEPGAGESAAAPDPGPQRESLADAIADLLQMAVNWLRAEASDLMRDKVVLPTQQLGLTLASAMAAAALMVIGLGFVFVAILMVLAKYLTWPGALALVGTLILIGAGIFTYIKMRSVQK
ncbi:MAG: hypothetical protein HGB10_01145 [Coriobacteriia bacterium]|nr:hypothetical protein [Coriobacteriia bacterium]